jgi:hypothetical protein
LTNGVQVPATDVLRIEVMGAGRESKALGFETVTRDHTGSHLSTTHIEISKQAAEPEITRPECGGRSSLPAVNP